MGLDQYLEAHKYVSGWDHAPDPKYDEILKLVGGTADPDSPSLTVQVNVAYWRKANAIHRWFVDKVQDSIDNCMPHYVTREVLEELLGVCKEIVQSDKPTLVGERLLPTQPGFFFGSTDYDEEYVEDIKDTIEKLERVLAISDAWDFYYRSSW